MENPETVEELTIAREGDERMAPRRELRKEVLATGSWVTVLYIYEELARKKAGDEWSKPKLALVRYRKLKGAYKFQKEFSISSLEQGEALRETLNKWHEMGPPASDA